MTCTIMIRRISSICTRTRAGLAGVLSCGGLLFLLGDMPVAHAVMGESAENRGLVVDTDKGEVLLACVLGAACQTNDEFFRRIAVGQINRGGTIEPNIDFAGIGFGSLVSTEVVPSEASNFLEDIFCWTGNDIKQCVGIFLAGNVGSTSLGGAIISVNSDDGSQCDDAASTFGQQQFDYLVKLDEDLYGEGSAVEVVTCNDVVGNNDVTAENIDLVGLGDVIIKAYRSMAAYDVKYFGGLYCCR